MSDVTMQELELETAELLPARETLCRPHSSFSVTQAGQFGLVNVGPIASGNNILSGIGVLQLKILHRDGSGHSACLLEAIPPRTRQPGDLPARHPVALGHGPGVRYLPNVLYGHHRTVPIPGQSMPTGPD